MEFAAAELRQVTDLGWDCPHKLIELKLEYAKIREAANLRGNGSSEAIALQMEACEALQLSRRLERW